MHSVEMNPGPKTIDATNDRGAVRRAVARAMEALWAEQLPDGSWDSPNEIGPHTTAQTIVGLRFVGRLDPRDAADVVRWLVAQQLDDGSFAGSPHAREGSLGATASALAAFHAAGLADDAAPVQRARAYIEAHGGIPAVIAARREGDLAALFLAMEGLCDARLIARPPVAPLLHPTVMRVAVSRINGGIVQFLAALSGIVRHLRGETGGLLATFERRHALALLGEMQCPNGSWTGANPFTVLSLCALHAFGVRDTDPRVSRALAWLRATQRRDADGLHYEAFPSATWSTALAVRALLLAGASRTDARVVRAVTWLVDAQSRVPQLYVGNREANAVRTGGWCFGPGTEPIPDCDTTSVTLSTLGIALASRAGDALPEELAARCRIAIDRGRAWLLGMQNRDGGWAAYTHDHPSKPRGAFMTSPLELPSLRQPRELLRFLADPPRSLGDPSTEDLTARAVFGLAHTGSAITSPETSHAIAFFREQQCDNGAFWGRWVVCYNATTAYVLRGLAAAGADTGAPWAQRALGFLVDHQNPDGGFGESIEAMRDPSLAGIGSSTAPMTGLAVSALVACGLAASEGARRGVRYLVAAQRADGTWDNGDFVSALIPPGSFYSLGAAVRTNALEALATFLDATRAPAPRR